jgi:hypothetical protein
MVKDYSAEAVGAELSKLKGYASENTLDKTMLKSFHAKVLANYRTHLGRRSLSVDDMVAEVRRGFGVRVTGVRAVACSEVLVDERAHLRGGAPRTPRGRECSGVCSYTREKRKGACID